MKKDEIIIDPIIISEYLHREKNGWDSKRENLFNQLIDKIKDRHPEYKTKNDNTEYDLSKLVTYYMERNNDTEHSVEYWRDRIDTNPRRHTLKVYDAKEAKNTKDPKTVFVEFLLFFDFQNNIDFVLNKFGYDELYIFAKEEWAAKVAIKIKDNYPDITPYGLYQKLLSDLEIQSVMADSNIDYNQALLLTSRAMPDFDKIDSIESARSFVHQYKNDFGRVRVTRYAMLETLLLQLDNHMDFEEIGVDMDDIEDYILFDEDIIQVLAKPKNIKSIIKFDSRIIKEIRHQSPILKDAQNILRIINQMYNETNKTIFDFIICPSDNCKYATYMYIEKCCRVYVQRVFNHKIGDWSNISPQKFSSEFKQEHHNACTKYIERCIEQGKHIINKANIHTDLLTNELKDLIKEINHTKTISRNTLLFSLIFSLSAQSFEPLINDPYNIDNAEISSKVLLDINDNILKFCSLSNIDPGSSKLDFLLSKSIECSSYKEIHERINEKDYYPYREFALSLLTQAQMQTQAEEVSH